MRKQILTLRFGYLFYKAFIMKVLIIEDEQHTAERLKQLIITYDPDIQILGELTTVRESIEWLRNNPLPDLIFQDIQLSDGNCFEIYENINLSTPVIFTTAFSEYAIKSFEVNSIDYLVKPYDINELKRALDKYHKYYRSFNVPEIDLLKEVLARSSSAYKRRFLIRIGDEFRFIQTEEVAYILSEDNLTFLITRTGKRHPLDQSLASLTLELDPARFFQVNRMCIINIKSIEKISTWFNGRLKLLLTPSVNVDIFVSRERVRQFKIWLNK